MTAEEPLRVAADLVRGLADAAVLLDANLRTIDASRPLEQLAGLRARQLQRIFAKGANIFSLFESFELPPEALETCLSRGTRACLFDVRGRSHGGEDFVVIVTLIPVKLTDSESAGVACIMRDVTAEVGLQHNYKALLAAEQKRAEQLEEVVKARTVDLQRALDEVTAQAAALEESNLRELALQKSVFAGRLATGLAHEFNSPLACVLANQAYLRCRIEEFAAALGGSHQEFTSLLEEALEILDEDSGSMKRLSATVSALQGSFTQTTNTPDAGEIIATNIEAILVDTKRALSGEGISENDVRFKTNAAGQILANAAEISLALVTLVMFLRNHEAAPETTSGGEAPLGTEPEIAAGDRHVTVSAVLDGFSCVISLEARDLHIDVDEAESAFDPSLVVSEGNRVKLSVDLSVCAARIARSGGSVQFAASPDRGGTIIEVHLMQATEPAEEEPIASVG